MKGDLVRICHSLTKIIQNSPLLGIQTDNTISNVFNFSNRDEVFHLCKTFLRFIFGPFLKIFQLCRTCCFLIYKIFPFAFLLIFIIFFTLFLNAFNDFSQILILFKLRSLFINDIFIFRVKRIYILLMDVHNFVGKREE